MSRYFFFLLFVGFFGPGCGLPDLHAQELDSGRVFTLHHVKVKLRKGVTAREFEDFMTREFLPAWEEHYEGLEAVLLEGIRGERKGAYSWINYYASEEMLRRFYPEAGKRSALGDAAAKKMKPWWKRLSSYASLRYESYSTYQVKAP